jgi:probable F420-dependent oxidoreductase
MKFGLRYCNTGRYNNPRRAVELIQAAEEAGFESAWTVDHVVVPSGYESAYPYSPDGKMAGALENMPLPDPLIWMTYVASATSRINLATGVLVLPQRNPVITAKQVATLDYLSGGRVLLGIGVGWLEEEFNALDAVFPERGPRTDEYMEAMRALWTSDRPTYQGKFVQFEDAFCEPKPANGSVPIIVGGHSKAAARRAGRLGDGFFPARGLNRDLVDLVRRTAEEAGRDPAEIEITASLPDDLDQIPELAKVGVDRILVPVLGMNDIKKVVSNPEDARAWAENIDKYRDL